MPSSRPETGYDREESPGGVHRLLVVPVPFDMSAADLYQIFRSQGPVRRAWLARDEATGRRRAHGYVEVESRRLAELLVERFNGKRVMGHSFSVAPVTAG